MKELNRLKAIASYMTVAENPEEDNVDLYVDEIESAVNERDLPLFDKERAIAYSERVRRNHHELSGR